MKRTRLFLATSLLLSTVATGSITVERFRLSNGLTVLVGVERRLPLVHVTCLYRIGGANEQAGTTGIAHFIEHMAFRATENVSKSDLTGAIERIGGRWTGYTWIDQTHYASTVPSWAMETVLSIEAERMSGVLFEPAEVERERTSVIAELQGYENDPASILWDLTVATSFEIHPYRYNVIGYLTDVLSIERDEAYRFYKDLYGPNNAVLAVVGDVDPALVREKVERYFGALKPATRSPEVRVIEPPQRAEKRLELPYPGHQKNLLTVFRAPEATDSDFPVLLVLDGILAGGRGLSFGAQEALPSSPLHRAIESAGGLHAFTSLTPSRAPYVYAIGVSSSTASDLKRVEASIQILLDRLGRAGPSESEIVAAQRRIRSKIAYETDTLGEVAHQLAYYEALGTWELADSIRTAVKDVTNTDIQSYVKKYLQPHRRTTGIHIPAEIEPEPTVEIPKLEIPDPVVTLPSPVPERALRPLEEAPMTMVPSVLSNGVALRVVSRSGDSAALRVRLAFGSELDPPEQEGLAMVAARTVLDDSKLSSRLAELGTQWNSSAESVTMYMGREYFDLHIRFLPDDLVEVVGEVASVLGRRQWSGIDIERVRMGLREEAAAAAGDASWIAEKEAVELVDPGWRPSHGTPASVGAIGPEDVNAFLSAHLIGGAVTVGLACPGDAEALVRELSRAFAILPSGERSPSRSKRGGPTSAEQEVGIVLMAGKTQSEIVAALPGIERSHPDYLPLQLLNYILGETGYAGRLGKELVDTGLAYSVYTIPQFGRRPGPLLIKTSAAPANLEVSLTKIREVVRSMAEGGVEEWEWKEAQAFRLGRLTVGIDSVDNLALALVNAGYYGDDSLDFEARSKRVLDLTRERLNEVARRYFRPELLRIGVAGDVPIPSPDGGTASQ